MSANERDDFSKETKSLLAGRAGYICAYPGCRRLTVGPSADRGTRLTIIGVAAHITAASIRGPRYDETLSEDERTSEHNGVWVCQNHAKLIDDNPSRCGVEELRRWKKQHEEWVFYRVSSGKDHIQSGLAQLRLHGIGCIADGVATFGRHNVVIGDNDAGKTTLCQAIAAMSGSPHYETFADRFAFGDSGKKPWLEVKWLPNGDPATIRLTSRPPEEQKRQLSFAKVLVEVYGGITVDWPRQLFRALHLDQQLAFHKGGLSNILRDALRYLAAVLGIPERLIWDSVSDGLYESTVLGYQFRRTGRFSVEARVPDGRQSYTRFELLSGSERACAFIDIALQFVRASAGRIPWIVMIDSGIFGRLDIDNKKRVFDKVINAIEGIQTIFCVADESDALALRDLSRDRWVGASALGEMTMHSFD